MASSKKKVGSTVDRPDAEERRVGNLAAVEAGASVPKITPIEIPALEIETMSCRIVGDSALICHKWSEKAIKQIRDKQTNTPSAGREAKVIKEEYESSLYKFPGGGYGFPAVAFKKAAVAACTSLGKQVTKVAAMQAFHVMGNLVRIEGEPEMREDAVKLNAKTADLRYRGEFKEWSCIIEIRFNRRVLSAAQILNLFNTAGFAVGVGEWRVEKSGNSGMFHVEAI